MRLTAFQCPNCGAKEMLTDAQDRLLCPYCGTSFGDVQRICFECGHFSEEGARQCQARSAPLVRDCPACGADNWVQADHCTECGRNLDLIGLMARRLQLSTQQRLQERQAAMADLKEDEEQASQRRMAVFLDMERDRQEALAQAAALRARRDKQILILVGVALGALVFVLVLAAILSIVAGSG
jgi:hypothetical protein